MVKLVSRAEKSTRAAILSAARQEFIENGLRGARMQEIADRAGINKALLHYHFRDKEGLYLAAIQSVVTTVVDQVVEPFSAHGQERTAAQRMEAMIRAYITVLRTNPELVGMALRELADGGHHLAPLLQGITPFVQELMASVIEHPGAQQNAATTLHLLLNMMSMIWGSFLLQPIYTQLFPLAGIQVTLDDAFFEERIMTITGIMQTSLGLRTGEEP